MLMPENQSSFVSVPECATARAHVDALQEAQREIQQLKSGFINTLVRDVRLPLAGVLGILELFESKLHEREPFDLEDRQLLTNALEHGDRIRHLLDDLLELTQARERPLTLNLTVVCATKLLEETIEPLRGEAALRGVELNVQVRDRQLELRVDVRQMRRAVCHLIEAALAVTPDGGTVNVEAQAILGTRTGDEGRRLALINVTDYGAGIAAEEVPFIFDAFWQVAAHSHKSAGCNIGLSIARRIAAAHGGNATVRSQLGHGTTYSIVLPAAPQDDLETKRRILIVDDAPEILLLQRKLVARMGYEVETAANAHQALEALSAQCFDLLLTDWVMPGMNGGELIKTIKQDEHLRHMPIVVLTCHETERDEALASGCNRFLLKPFKRDDLQRIINELLFNEGIQDTELRTQKWHFTNSESCF